MKSERYYVLCHGTQWAVMERAADFRRRDRCVRAFVTQASAEQHWYNCLAAQLSEVEAAELIVRLQALKVRPLRPAPGGNRAA
ncbi:MAG TPA: hypothetical protein VNQ79_29145 [Blastocatellia bacterium]|nr:hypothetical protein [Blastocatellia bacterium]